MFLAINSGIKPGNCSANETRATGDLSRSQLISPNAKNLTYYGDYNCIGLSDDSLENYFLLIVLSLNPMPTQYYLGISSRVS